MSTRGNPSNPRESIPAQGPEGPSGAGRSGRKKLLLVAGGVALLLLASGALYGMWSHAGTGSEADANPPASKKSKHAEKPSKSASKHEKPAAKPDKKSAEEGKHAGKPPAKSGKGHAKPEGESQAATGKEKGEGKSPEGAEAAQQPVYLGEGRARLGPFTVKIFDPLTRTMLRTDFNLEAVLNCEDEAEFQQFLRSNLQFFREQIMVAMRTSDAVDFADSSLALVKRRMIARVNRAMGRRFLKSVEIKDFAVYESVDNAPYVRWQPAAAEGP